MGSKKKANDFKQTKTKQLIVGKRRERKTKFFDKEGGCTKGVAVKKRGFTEQGRPKLV